MLGVIEYFAKSLKVIRNGILEKGVNPCQYFDLTMSVSRTVTEIFSVKQWCDLDLVIWGYRSFEVTETGTIRKQGYVILFAFHSNYGSMLQHFEDKARYWSKISKICLFVLT